MTDPNTSPERVSSERVADSLASEQEPIRRASDICSSVAHLESERTHQTPDERISSWAVERADVLFSGERDRQSLQQKIGEVDRRFSTELIKLLPNKSASGVMNALCAYAEDRFIAAKEELHQQELSEHRETRAQIERVINHIWEEVGECRGRNCDYQREELLRSRWCALEPKLDAILTEQLVAGLEVGDPRRESLHRTLQETIERLREEAEKRGEEQCLEANRVAMELHAALPRTKANANRVYEILRKLSPEERKRSLSVFEERYSISFEEALDKAYNSFRARLGSFLKLPVWKAALQEGYGLGVGAVQEIEKEMQERKKRVRHLFKRVKGAFIGAAQVIEPHWREPKEVLRRLRLLGKELFETAKGPELSRLEAISRGDRVTAITDTLFLSLTGSGDPFLVIPQAMQQLSTEDRKEVTEDFAKRYAKRLDATSLEDAVRLALAGEKKRSQRECVLSSIEGDMARAEAFRMRIHLAGKKEEFVAYIRKLEETTASHRAELKVRYHREFGEVLDQRHMAKCQRYLRKGPLIDWAVEVVEGREKEAAAARLRAAMNGSSDEWPGSIFYSYSRLQNAAIIERYNDRYGTDFWSEFRRRRGDERTRVMRASIESEPRTVDLIRHCIKGLRPDVQGLRTILGDLTKVEQAKLKKEYGENFSQVTLNPVRWALGCAQAPFGAATDTVGGDLIARLRSIPRRYIDVLRKPRDLDRDLHACLHGHNFFDIGELRAGKTEDPHENMARFLRRYEHEHAGREYRTCDAQSSETSSKDRALRSGLLARMFPPKPDLVRKDRDVEAVVRFYERNIRDKTPLSPELRQFQALLKIAHQSLDIMREMKNKKAEGVSNLGALTTTAGAIFALSALSVPIPTVMIAVSLMSMTGRYTVKTIIKGDGYGMRESSRDLFLASVDGATLALGKWLKGLKALRVLSIGKPIVSTGAKFGAKRTLRKFANTKFTSALLEDRNYGHVRHLAELEQSKLLEEYGSHMHRAAEQVLRRDDQFDSVRSVREVFRRIGRDLQGGIVAG